jgi:DNA-binding Lrp family transcriptional regulator
MACWAVPEERIDDVAQVLAASPRVSHCYRRPTFPDWPYALFSMVHARSRQQCEGIVAELSRLTGISDYTILYSTREYKKERVQYFVEQGPPAA